MEIVSLIESRAAPGLAAARAGLATGGPVMAVIAALSVIVLALILWKIWRMLVGRVWARVGAERALALWQAGAATQALKIARATKGPRARTVEAAFVASRALVPSDARAETIRIAKRQLAAARSGLRMFELIAVIAPLLGLLGTVLGMIAAFQSLQAAGGAADPATLAGGIWQALGTTAAGMIVAIPASVALSLFEGAADRLRRDLEDLGTRALQPPPARDHVSDRLAPAAE